MTFLFLLILIISTLLPSQSAIQPNVRYQQDVNSLFSKSNHTSNYAIIVSTSRYYFNYRHNNNALSIYNLIKNYGNIPDSNIILMLAHDFSHDPRNPHKNQVISSTYQQNENNDLTGNEEEVERIEVDYQGDEVNIENLMRVLLGRPLPGEGTNRQLLNMDENSNLLLFLTGHGGDQFFKFHDLEEITSTDFLNVFTQMKLLKRYNSMLFVVDTCQAFTLSDELYGNEDDENNENLNIISVASSLKDENSYAHSSNYHLLKMSLIDRFSYAVHQFFFRTLSKHNYNAKFIQKKQDNNSKRKETKDDQSIFDNISIRKVFGEFSYAALRSHVGIRGKIDNRSPSQVSIADFIQNAEIKSIMSSIQEGVQDVNMPRIISLSNTTNKDYDEIYGIMNDMMKMPSTKNDNISPDTNINNLDDNHNTANKCDVSPAILSENIDDQNEMVDLKIWFLILCLVVILYMTS